MTSDINLVRPRILLDPSQSHLVLAEHLPDDADLKDLETLILEAGGQVITGLRIGIDFWKDEAICQIMTDQSKRQILFAVRGITVGVTAAALKALEVGYDVFLGLGKDACDLSLDSLRLVQAGVTVASLDTLIEEAILI